MSHQIEPRKKRKPTSHDHPNAARGAQERNRSSHGTSATHAHHGWLKLGKDAMSSPALTTARSGRGKTREALRVPDETVRWISRDVLAMLDGRDLKPGAPGEPLERNFVYVTAMADAMHPHLLTDDLIEDAIISYSELPVPLEAMPQRFSIVGRLGREPLFDGLLDPSLQVSVDAGEVVRQHGGVIDNRGGHYRRRFFRCPHTCSCVKAFRRSKVAARA